MTTDAAGAIGTNGFQDLIKRFWGFDHMIGGALIKIIYYIGLVALGLLALWRGLAALRMLEYSATNGLGSLVVTLLVAAVSVVFWRFVCELWLLMFLMYNRMGEIKDRLPPR